jgi:molybdenum cofactor synthesis domain-containing protein
MRVGILTVSDRSAAGEREDRSGPALEALIEEQQWQVARQDIVADDQAQIERALTSWSDSNEIDLLLTTGGTGFAPRDVTPEATAAVIDKSAPGFAEVMRIQSLKVTAHAMLSRAIAGIRGSTLIINLPGSPKAARENLQFILPAIPHAISILQEDPKSEAGHIPGPSRPRA